jgi:hypothetical protein
MDNPELVIGTVLSEDESAAKWYEIQTRFIKNNTQDVNYEFVVAASEKFNYLDGKWVQKADSSHVGGLKSLNDYFLTTNASYFLYLDSDAFPIRPNWFSKLKSLLFKYKKDYAAPVRCENLECFAHISFLFLRANYFKLMSSKILECCPSITFSFANNFGVNKCGPGSRLPVEDLFPLFRSNITSPHPSLYSVYYGLVYHHGGGSRGEHGYMFSTPYWEDSEIKMDVSADNLIFENAEKFIATICETTPCKNLNPTYKKCKYWPVQKIVKFL